MRRCDGDMMLWSPLDVMWRKNKGGCVDLICCCCILKRPFLIWLTGARGNKIMLLKRLTDWSVRLTDRSVSLTDRSVRSPRASPHSFLVGVGSKGELIFRILFRWSWANYRAFLVGVGCKGEVVFDLFPLNLAGNCRAIFWSGVACC